MKIRSRRIIDFVIQAVLLVILVVPSLARVGVQCPFPLLTQNGSYNQNNPEISLDPNCRNVNVSNFTDICRVDISPTTGQPSGRTVLPRFANSSSILLVNANAPNAPGVAVWLSTQTTDKPGCVTPSSGPMTWTTP